MSAFTGIIFWSIRNLGNATLACNSSHVHIINYDVHTPEAALNSWWRTHVFSENGPAINADVFLSGDAGRFPCLKGEEEVMVFVKIEFKNQNYEKEICISHYGIDSVC